MSRFIVYALLCPRCGCPRYVGQSSRGEYRFRQHLRGMKASDDCHHKKRWVQSLLDAGLSPVWRVLLELPAADDLDAAETYWIQALRDRGCPLTNLTDGGCGRRGHRDTPETIERRRQKLLGRPVPQERRDRISATLKGRPSAKKGRPLSAAELVSHARARAIPPFQDETGRVYRTIREAALALGVSDGNICAVLKGRRHSAGGHTFRPLTPAPVPG